MARAPSKPAAKKSAAKSVTKPAAKKPAPAAKAAASAKPAQAKPAQAKAAAPAKPAQAKAAQAKAAQAKPAASARAAQAKPAASAKAASAKAASAKPAPAGKGKSAAPTPAASPRFGFLAVPVVRDRAGLTPLLRRQLAVDTLLSTGRTTTPDRIPATYFTVGIHRWRVTEKGKPVFDVVQNTAFFADSDEPVGLERIQGSWEATGREARRGLELDLHHLAWELNRDWPGRRLPLGAEPRPNQKVDVVPGLRDQPWPADATFV